jgi:hypothetical protein
MFWLFLWSVFLCSSIEWEGWKAWMAWWRWLRVFIASNHFLAVGWLCCRWAHRTVWWCTRHSTVHYPVSATSADRWILELLTIEVLCPLAAPDSPVAHWTVPCILTLQFWLLTSALSTFPLSALSIVGKVDHCSVGSPDSPMNFSGVALRKPESSQFVKCFGLGTGQCLVRHWQHQILYAPNFIELSQFFFFVCLCWTLCTWEK